MSASFHYLSFMHHADLVGILDCRESVCDGYGGSCRGEPVKCFLDELLGFRIEGRCSLVENEYVRVLEYCTGYADSLSLAAGKPSAAVSDIGVVSVFLLHDEVVGVGDLCSGDDFFHGSTFHSEGYVVEDCVIEEYGLLIHVSYEAPEVLDLEFPDVGAVQPDRSLLDIIVSRS